MLDVYSDLTQQSAAFGNHFEIVEMCELFELRQSVGQAEISDKISEFRDTFDVSGECEQEELERTAKTSVALDKLVEKHGLGLLAYDYEDRGEYENIITSVGALST